MAREREDSVGQGGVGDRGQPGIGAATARRLATLGAGVVITYVAQAEKAKAVVEELRSQGVRAEGIQADQADRAQVTAMGLPQSAMQYDRDRCHSSRPAHGPAPDRVTRLSPCRSMNASRQASGVGVRPRSFQRYLPGQYPTRRCRSRRDG